ncbi:MAG: ribosome small subunit-dependent GTPase A [Bdellovibrionota bacterium]
MNLSDWGHSAFFSAETADGEFLGRVVEEMRTLFSVVTEKGLIQAQLSGRLLHPKTDRIERPIAGDWVILKSVGGENKGIIQSVLPRKTLLKRKAPGTDEAVQLLVANVDMAFVVTSANRDYNPKRIDRYLTIIHESGAKAAVLLTKCDLDAAGSAKILREITNKYSVPCLALSSVSGEGMRDLEKMLVKGLTYVFLGSSGVGKSTLVNHIMAREEQVTKAIRETDDRGRHTTTSRRMIVMPNGALVIDTPGLREIQLDASQTEGLETRFARIETLGAGCRFSNCGHESEPGCAVKKALEEGSLDKDEYDSYLKLRAQIQGEEKKLAKTAGKKVKNTKGKTKRPGGSKR